LVYLPGSTSDDPPSAKPPPPQLAEVTQRSPIQWPRQ